MTYIPVVAESDADGVLAEAFRTCREQFAIAELPPIVHCFGARPDLLIRWAEFARALLFATGHLDRGVREAIATYVSGLNACPHCVDSHGYFLRLQGVDLESVRSLQKANPKHVKSVERPLFDLVKKVTERASAISPLDIETVHQAGWSHDQISEAIYTTAYFCFINRIADAFGVPSQGLLDSADPTTYAHLAVDNPLPAPSAVEWLHDNRSTDRSVVSPLDHKSRQRKGRKRIPRS